MNECFGDCSLVTVNQLSVELEQEEKTQTEGVSESGSRRGSSATGKVQTPREREGGGEHAGGLRRGVERGRRRAYGSGSCLHPSYADTLLFGP